MADAVMVDDFSVEGLKQSEINGEDYDKKAKKSLKRKRASIVENMSVEEKEAWIDSLRRELEGLFQYFKELSLQKLKFDMNNCCSSNSFIAFLLEESNLPFSKLVEDIYEKLKGKEGVTLASVRSQVLFIGQRLMYGVSKADADVLEDETESCFWCWETRDLKLMPKTWRGVLNVRRTCRRKIHERISAVSGLITILQRVESHPSYRIDVMKASEKLTKVLNEAEIRLLVESMMQKNAADIAEKEVKLKERELIRELERNKREVEKEKKRMDRELLKEKFQSEKELKRLLDEAEKEERKREKEEAETKKQLRRQQEEAEKEQRRREKEEAEKKKQLAVQKQATIMERFLKCNRNDSASQHQESSSKEMASEPSKDRYEEMHSAVTLSIDCGLSMKDEINLSDLRKSHLNSWHQLGHYIRTNKSQHWGMRHKPKVKLVKELRLTSNKGLIRADELNLEKLADGWEETAPDDRSCNNDADISQSNAQKCNRPNQLLQFDKSYRPAFYGIWPKKSHVVRGRCPFKKDQDLDYDIDSDEEWEEEDPGESLSDTEKDHEEEMLEEGNLRTDDEDGSEDGFLVPDGYLSENEGVQVERTESEPLVDDASSPSCMQDLETEELQILFRQQKYLLNATEHALRKNQPLVISNLIHEKSVLLMAEDLSGMDKLVSMCLKALSIQAFPVGPPIEITVHNNLADEDLEVSESHIKGNTTQAAAVPVILDSDLPQFVNTIRSCPYGMSKVVESLQRKFPTISKSQLKTKVREVSEFVDNRWQVKKDILYKLGLSISPDKGTGRTKGIASFFSKRCLPPSSRSIGETSPQPCQKPDTKHE